MTSEELRHLEDLPSPHNKFWVPCTWFVSLALRARTEGRINNDVALTALLTVGPQSWSRAEKTNIVFERNNFLNSMNDPVFSQPFSRYDFLSTGSGLFCSSLCRS